MEKHLIQGIYYIPTVGLALFFIFFSLKKFDRWQKPLQISAVAAAASMLLNLALWLYRLSLPEAESTSSEGAIWIISMVISILSDAALIAFFILFIKKWVPKGISLIRTANIMLLVGIFGYTLANFLFYFKAWEVFEVLRKMSYYTLCGIPYFAGLFLFFYAYMSMVPPIRRPAPGEQGLAGTDTALTVRTALFGKIALLAPLAGSYLLLYVVIFQQSRIEDSFRRPDEVLPAVIFFCVLIAAALVTLAFSALGIINARKLQAINDQNSPVRQWYTRFVAAVVLGACSLVGLIVLWVS